MNLTVVVPFWNGHAGLPKLLASIPPDIPVIVVNDYGSSQPDTGQWPNVRVVNLNKRGYFSGACNAGFATCQTDVLILNQDGALLNGWQRALQDRGTYGIIGDGVMGHPAWPNGYVQGTFMFIRRDVLSTVGNFNVEVYPLWGATSEYQLRACRQGFRALPIDVDPFFAHARGGKAYGTAISKTLQEQPDQRRLFIKTPPEISVVITTHNFVEYLQQAVQSILDQTFQATEIIIVDDGSTDGTGRLGRQLEDRWKGIQYIYQENQGASVAANTGIAVAKGRYITVLDGDDWMAPTRLEKLYALALEHAHSVIYDDVMFVHNGRQEHKRIRDYDFERLLERNMMHKGILYPKKAWLKVGGYSKVMDNGREDWEFNIKLGLAGWCGVHLPEPLYMYRRQGQGRTQKVPRPRSYFRDKIARIHPDVYEQGARPMACCGGRRAPRKSSKVTIKRTPVRSAPELTDPPAKGYVALEYTGQSIGNQTIFGPSGSRYKYGRNERNLRFWCQEVDVEFLLSTGLFERFVLQRKAAPKPEKVKDEPQVTMSYEKLTEMEAAKETPVQATRYAESLAEKVGISLEDVPYEGDKIGIKDVRDYLEGLGIEY